MESSFTNNERNGMHISYHPNGKIYSQGLYKKDIKSGVWEYFNSDGVIDTLINYNE